MTSLIYNLQGFDHFSGNENKIIKTGDVMTFSICNPPYQKHKTTFKLFNSSGQQIHFANDEFGHLVNCNMYSDEHIDYIVVYDNNQLISESFGNCDLLSGGLATLYGVIKFKKEGVYTASYNTTKYNVTVKRTEKNAYDNSKDLNEIFEYYKLDDMIANFYKHKHARQSNPQLFFPEYDNIFPNDKQMWHTIKTDTELMYNYEVDCLKDNHIWTDYSLSYLNGGAEIPITFKLQPAINILPQPWRNMYVSIKVVLYTGPCDRPIKVENNKKMYCVIIKFKKQGTYIFRKISRNELIEKYHETTEKLLANSLITVE